MSTPTTSTEQHAEPDVKWLTGFWEGEGSFYVQRPRRDCKRPQVRLVIYQKDSRVLYRIKNFYGGSVTKRLLLSSRGIKDRVCHNWTLTGDAATLLMRRMLLYIQCPRRRANVNGVLSAVDAYDAEYSRGMGPLVKRRTAQKEKPPA